MFKLELVFPLIVDVTSTILYIVKDFFFFLGQICLVL